MVAGGGLTAIGGTRHGAHDLNGFDAFETKHYDRSGGHGFKQYGEEGAVNEVSVMLAQNLGRELHHLHAGYDKPLCLEAGEHAAHQSTLYRGRLKMTRVCCIVLV